MKRSITGFTIVELLIVIVVIAILAAISVVAYTGIQERARISAHAHAAAQAEKAIMTHALQNGGESISLSNAIIGYKKGAGDVDLLRPLVGYPDITMYVVYEVLGTALNYPRVARLNPSNAGNHFILQGGATGSNQMSYRIDTSAQAASSGVVSIRSPGNTVIGWLQVSNNGLARAMGYSQPAPHASGVLSAHDGWEFTSVSAISDTDGITKIVLVFNTAHDQATRQQVINWLAQKYGVSL